MPIKIFYEDTYPSLLSLSEDVSADPHVPPKFHFVFMGDNYTAGRQLTERFLFNRYSDAYVTPSDYYGSKSFTLFGETVKIGVHHPLPGDPHRVFRSVSARAVIIHFDLTDEDALANIPEDIDFVNRNYRLGTKIILVAIRAADLLCRRVGRTEIELLLSKNPCISAYLETDAKSNHHVETPFSLLTGLLLHEKAPEKFMSPASFCAPSSSSPLLLKKLDLLIKLNQYIERTERQDGDGFWFFRKSRCINRKANRLLATELRRLLVESPMAFEQDLLTIFSDIKTKRSTIIANQGLNQSPDFVERGINSAELNKIIQEGATKPFHLEASSRFQL